MVIEYRKLNGHDLLVRDTDDFVTALIRTTWALVRTAVYRQATWGPPSRQRLLIPWTPRTLIAVVSLASASSPRHVGGRRTAISAHLACLAGTEATSA